MSGSIGIYDRYDTNIIELTAATYYLKYSPQDKFIAELPQGNHSLLIIRLDNNWFTPNAAANYPGFATVLESYFGMSPTFVLLAQQVITRQIQKLLIAIRTKIIQRPGDGLTVLSYIQQIVDIFHEQLCNSKATEALILQEYGHRLKAYLAANYMHDDRCKTAQIQQALGCTAWTLRKVSAEMLGCSIPQYVAQLRIAASLNLLSDKKQQIHDIAIQVGFSCATSYIRAFKASKGCTPNEYRKK